MANVAQNFRFALRQLGRNRGFTTTVILTLALSIGANTAIFSLVNALMLKNLPYPHPDRLGTIFMTVRGSSTSIEGDSIDGEQWELLRDKVPSLLSGVASGISAGVNLQAGQKAEYVRQSRISAGYLDVLGIHPSMGRSFTEDEDRPNGPRAVILSYSLWQNAFAGDRGLVGQVIRLKSEPYTVVGILPQGVQTPSNADLYTPLKPSRTGEGMGTNYEVIVRLRDGATWQQADTEIQRAWADRARRFEQEFAAGSRVSFQTVPLQRGQTSELRPKAIALMAAAGFILLIACGNLAGLTLVRMARQTPEIATRLALGASHWQIQRQLWTESLLLALAGGTAGIACGYAALHGLLALLPEGYLPVRDVPLDLRVLAFTSCVAMLTSLLFGMLPALAVRNVDLRSSMSKRGIAGSERLRLRQILIAGEIALTVVLLAGAGLLIRTLIHLETLPPGFDPNNVMTAKASLDDLRYHDPATFNTMLNKSIAAMERIPGVQSAAVGLSLPFERSLNDGVKLSDGENAGQQVMTGSVYVTPGYFETLRIPLLAGRPITISDTSSSQHVAVVNRAFAQKFFHGANPIGHVLDNGTVIVGLVGDVQVKSGLDPVAPLQSEQMMYFPAAQVDPKLLAIVHVWFQPSWIVRTAGPLEGLTSQMQRALSDVDPSLPFSGFHRMSDLEASALFNQRLEVALLGTMAGLALLLSGVGIFALVANLIAQRTREIGIRMALGSSVSQAMGHVAGSGIRAALAGLTLGLLHCAAVLRILRSALYGVTVYDTPTLGSVILLLVLVALAAAGLPALRIARIDPASTLREE